MNMAMSAARRAGLFYLVYMVFHIGADVIGRSRLIVYGDAARTATNVGASAMQFRAGIVGDLIGAALFLLAAWALYVLLKPVNENIALLFLLVNLGGVAVQCSSDVFLLAGQLLLSGPDYLSVFQADQLPALAMLSLYVYKSGFAVAQIFYGAWLFPLGYLVYKSGFLPRALGIVLMAHFVFWTLTALQVFLFPSLGAIAYVSWPLGFIAEFGLTLWLLIKGAKAARPALATAA